MRVALLGNSHDADGCDWPGCNGAMWLASHFHRPARAALTWHTVRTLSTTERIRNIGIIAHVDAGKTTTTEQMILRSGLTRRAGTVDTGDTVMDFMPEERERGITIGAAAISLPWRGHLVNLIDTPGHVDFSVEVERTLRVLDGAVVVLDGTRGVQAQTLAVWRQAERHGVARLVLVNKMDRPGATVARTLADIRACLRREPLLLNAPVFNAKGELEGVRDETGKVELQEQLALHDETFMEAYLEGRATADNVKHALRRVACGDVAVPVLFGSAARGIGIEALLDAVVDLLPSPRAVNSGAVGTTGTDAPALALAFKVVYDVRRRGLLVYVRVYAGVIRRGMALFNANRRGAETLGRIMRVMADELVEVETAEAGAVVVLTGLAVTATGDTLAASRDAAPLAGIDAPTPVIGTRLEAEGVEDQEALDAALRLLLLEDPSAQTVMDAHTGQTILRGMGELHLEILQTRLRDVFGARFRSSSIVIAYREVLLLDRVHFGEAHIDRDVCGVRLRAGVALEVTGAADHGPAPAVLLAPTVAAEERGAVEVAVLDGIQAALAHGPLAGHLVDKSFQVTVRQVTTDASSVHAIRVAAQAAMGNLLADAARNGSARIHEPVVRVELSLPERFVGDVTTDLFSTRRCISLETAGDDDCRQLVAIAPLRTMLGYSTWLRARTGGMGTLTMESCGYAEMTGESQNERAMAA